MFSDLGRLLRHAKTLGMRTTVTSNGMTLNGSRLRMLNGCTDVLAISLDGFPESHNRMRASDQAFERMLANLDGVRASGIDFGFIFTLTRQNVNEIDWVARFTVEQGAKLLQIHPLEQVGRAADVLAGCQPDEIESSYAYIEAERIRRRYGTRLFVQLDLFHRDLMIRHPERFYGSQDSRTSKLAEFITPLVVEADGYVVPLGYGFARAYALGNLRKQSLCDLAKQWLATGRAKFQELCRKVYSEACTPSDLPFLNWYELIGLRAGVLS
jgi:MoaA/NifB/PqqE/SkfB family radical SAM enzyme